MKKNINDQKIYRINTRVNVTWDLIDDEDERIEEIFDFHKLFQEELRNKGLEYESIKNLHTSTGKKELIILFDNTEVVSNGYYHLNIYKKIIPILIQSRASTSISFGDIIPPKMGSDLKNKYEENICSKTNDNFIKEDLNKARYSAILMSNISKQMINKIKCSLSNDSSIKGIWNIATPLDSLISINIPNDICILKGVIVQRRIVDSEIYSIDNSGWMKYDTNELFGEISVGINEWTYDLFLMYDFGGQLAQGPLYRNSISDKEKYNVSISREKWEFLKKCHPKVVSTFKTMNNLINQTSLFLKESQWTNISVNRKGDEVVLLNVLILVNGVKYIIGLKTENFKDFHITTAI